MYFKREFDKKRGNCGVLARFVLFLAGMGYSVALKRLFYQFVTEYRWIVCG